MTETTKRGMVILAASLLLGIAGDWLLVDRAPGLNVFLWITLTVMTLLIVARQSQTALEGEGHWLLLPAVLLASGFAWRNSAALLVLDVGAMAVCLAGAVAFGKEGQIRVGYLTGYLLGGLSAAARTLGGFVSLLFHDIQWNELPRGRRTAQIAAGARGLLIALPLLLLFGALFISADAAFAGLAANLFDFQMDEQMAHLMATGLFTWLAAGFLRSALSGPPANPDPVQRPAVVALGAVELGVVLGLLNALFLAFVLVQFRYFFGGTAIVVTSATLTYAEYARSGFFELVGVSALVMPLLLLGHWLIPAEQPGLLRLFRWLAGALVALLFIIMVSAVHRMLLYQQEFGLTEQRLFATAFMGWLAILFVWFLATVLRGRRDRFAFGALVSGLVMLGALHILNPDGFIARTNLNRAADGRAFDAMYVASLSADAVPVLLEALPHLPEQERQRLIARLRTRWERTDADGWHSWNWGRARAAAMISKHLD